MSAPVFVIHGIGVRDRADFTAMVARLESAVGGVMLHPIFWGDLGAKYRWLERTIPLARTADEVRGPGGPNAAPNDGRNDGRNGTEDEARALELAALFAGGDTPTEVRDDEVPQPVIEAALANLRTPGEEIRDGVTVAQEVRDAIAARWPETRWLRLVQDPQLLEAVGAALTEPLSEPRADRQPAGPTRREAPAGVFEIRDEEAAADIEQDPAVTVEVRGIDLRGFVHRRIQDLDRVVGAAFGAAGGKLNAYLRTSLLPGITRFAGDILVYQRHRSEIAQRVRDVIHAVDGAAGSDAENPVTIVAHSLGGVIAVDLATADDPLWVRSLVTFGSQSPFFHVCDPRGGRLQPFDGGPPVRLPPSIGSWTNLWEPFDPLAFIAGKVFQMHDQTPPDDQEVDHLMSSGLWTHSAYWELDALSDAVRKSVR